jgi:hypothetical protein
VFPHPACDVVGDPDVKGSAFAAGEDVNVVGHRYASRALGPGNKPYDIHTSFVARRRFV